MDSRPRFACNVVEGVFKVVWTSRPLEVDVEVADVAVVAVEPRFAVVTVFEPSEAPTEVVLGWFAAFSSSSGCSNRPRSKDMVMDRMTVVVCSLCVDFNMVEL